MNGEHFCSYNPQNCRFTHYNFPSDVGDWEYISPAYYVIEGCDQIYYSESALKRMGIKGRIIRQFAYITLPNPRYQGGAMMRLYTQDEIF